MKRTAVINLFAGPGVGKSTLAAALFAEMKKQGKSVEMAREWIKLWAWEGKIPTLYDQFLIFGNQVHEETALYGKVDYIITDSPILLSPFYEKQSFNSMHTLLGAKAVLEQATKSNVVHMNFLLKRTRPYQADGRYQTEKQAKALDKKLVDFLTEQKVVFETASNIFDIMLEFEV